MGIAHGLLDSAGLALNTASLLLRATGRRNARRLAFLGGYSLNGAGSHVGGELSYGYGLRVNRNVFEWAGPEEFTPCWRRASYKKRTCDESRSTATTAAR